MTPFEFHQKSVPVMFVTLNGHDHEVKDVRHALEGLEMHIEAGYLAGYPEDELNADLVAVGAIERFGDKGFFCRPGQDFQDLLSAVINIAAIGNNNLT